MTAIVQELLKRSDLPRVVCQLNEALDAERRRREEFIAQLDESTYAEFINGEVVLHSPERLEHGEAEDNLKLLLKTHVRQRDLGLVAGNKVVRTQRNDYIPDLCYWPKDVADKFEAKTAIFPPPALAIEVLSDSTEANDRGIKFTSYAEAGVREFWLVDPEARRIEQYENREGVFHLRAGVIADQTLRCAVLPGLNFPAAAAFDSRSNAIAIAALPPAG